MKDLDGLSLNDTQEHITRLAIEESATNLIEAGSVIVATRVGLGKVAMNSVPVAINQDLKALYVNDKALARYLMYYLHYVAKQLEAAGYGATVRGITLALLRAIEIPVPSLSEQVEIVARLDRIERAMLAQQANIERTKSLMESALHRAFRGEL